MINNTTFATRNRINRV